MDFKKYPEFDGMINRIVTEAIYEINGAWRVESEMPYKCQHVLEEVIKKLQEAV